MPFTVHSKLDFACVEVVKRMAKGSVRIVNELFRRSSVETTTSEETSKVVSVRGIERVAFRADLE